MFDNSLSLNSHKALSTGRSSGHIVQYSSSYKLSKSQSPINGQVVRTRRTGRRTGRRMGRHKALSTGRSSGRECVHRKSSMQRCHKALSTGRSSGLCHWKATPCLALRARKGEPFGKQAPILKSHQHGNLNSTFSISCNKVNTTEKCP